MSILISTYQAGRIASIGVHRGELRIRVAHFDRAMALTGTSKKMTTGTFGFNTRAKKAFAAHAQVLMNYRVSMLVGPDPELDNVQSVWMVPTFVT